MLHIWATFVRLEKNNGLFKENAFVIQQTKAAEKAFSVFWSCLKGDIKDGLDKIRDDIVGMDNPSKTKFEAAISKLCKEVLLQRVADKVNNYLQWHQN